MVVQYPDTIVITRNGGSTQDADGNWIETQGETITLKCRFVPNGSGKQIKVADGSNFTYGYRIAFPFGTTNVREMDTFKRGDEVGTIMRFEIGQLHSVAWV